MLKMYVEVDTSKTKVFPQTRFLLRRWLTFLFSASPDSLALRGRLLFFHNGLA